MAEESQAQSLIGHLIELKARLLKGLCWFLGCFAITLYFSNPLYHSIAQPLLDKLPDNNHLVAIKVASPFLVPIKLSFFFALFLAMPALFYQLWAFILPGLYQHERYFARLILVTSTILFYLGAAFAYFIVFPLIFGFFVGTAPQGVLIMTDLQHYLTFVVQLFLAFGIAFEMPVATFILIKSGWVSTHQLSRNRGYVILLSFILGMVLTPPDIVSQLMLAIPIWLLFELGLLISRLTEKNNSNA